MGKKRKRHPQRKVQQKKEVPKLVDILRAIAAVLSIAASIKKMLE